MAIVAIGIETLMICPLISTRKNEATGEYRRPDKVTGMQFPSSIRLAEWATGSTVLSGASRQMPSAAVATISTSRKAFVPAHYSPFRSTLIARRPPLDSGDILAELPR
jgi:hypothetical protein